MKKLIALVIAAICMLSMGGCQKTSSGSSVISAGNFVVEVISSDESVKLSEEDSKTIFELLENGEWKNDLSACASDCSLAVSGNTLTYHFECGTFNDNQNKRSLSTDDDTRKAINDILGNYISINP